MVSFWPFRGGDSSAAGFEKILASLSTKINKTSAKDARLRTQQRRFRVLWTLYTVFTYLVALLILVLVVGRSNWDYAEWSGLAGGPVVIYIVRLGIDAFYNYRLSGTQVQLDELYKQRSEAIDKLKAATKYNSTQQLLDKYGGSSPKPKSPQGPEKRKNATSPKQPPVQRTGLPPPPTANIQRPPQPSLPNSPISTNTPNSRPTSPHHSPQPSAEFAPNAFDTAPPRHDHLSPSAVSSGPSSGPHWYDRILDVILGEDETQARNRIVLICKQCRLVNGQAPPGTRTLEDLGRWRCMACGALNGSESVAAKAVKEAEAAETGPRIVKAEKEAQKHDEDEDGDVEMVEVGHDGSDEGDDVASTAREARAKARQRKK